MKHENILRNQQGFTLIEIIAVLVILGILAAVAVPKYIDLQNEAKKSTCQAALAAGGSMVATAYAKALMTQKGAEPTFAQVMTAMGQAADTDVTVGDFKVQFSNAAATDAITVTVTSDKDGNAPSGYAEVAASDYTKNFTVDISD